MTPDKPDDGKRSYVALDGKDFGRKIATHPHEGFAVVDLAADMKLWIRHPERARELLRAAFAAVQILDPDGATDSLINDLLSDEALAKILAGAHPDGECGQAEPKTPVTHYANPSTGLVGDIARRIPCGTTHWAIVSDNPRQVTCQGCLRKLAAEPHACYWCGHQGTGMQPCPPGPGYDGKFECADADVCRRRCVDNPEGVPPGEPAALVTAREHIAAAEAEGLAGLAPRASTAGLPHCGATDAVVGLCTAVLGHTGNHVVYGSHGDVYGTWPQPGDDKTACPECGAAGLPRRDDGTCWNRDGCKDRQAAQSATCARCGDDESLELHLNPGGGSGEMRCTNSGACGRRVQAAKASAR
jgi:hypothetical protein